MAAEEKNSFPFYELVAAASKAAAEYYETPEAQEALREKLGMDAEEFAASMRKEGRDEESIEAFLVRGGFRRLEPPKIPTQIVERPVPSALVGVAGAV